MQIILLGTNGWYDTEMGNTISILVKTEEHYIIFDAGNGIYKLDRYLPKNKKSEAYLFISHFHLDHISGLHIFCKFCGSLKRLTLSGPEGTKNVIKTLAAKPFTVPIKDLEYDLDIYELPADSTDFPFKIKTLPLLHADLTLGYRLETEGKVITYCPDTGYCPNAVELAKNADLLITECSFKSGQSLPNWPHLNPEDAARIAEEGGAKKLLLVHFAPDRFLNMEDREIAAENAGKIFENTLAGKDEMRVDV